MFKRSLIVVLALMLVLGTSGAASAAKAQKCTSEQGQLFIDQGRYKDAIRAFTCVIDAAPTEAEGYRGRSEALLFLGRYSDAYADYARITALVMPVHPDAEYTILAGYDARLAAHPQSIPALTGAGFARWVFFDYKGAIQLLDTLLAVRPDDVFGTLFRGSSRVLRGASTAQGVVDLERAIELAPQSADVRYIVADAYLYGRSDYSRAFQEASLALEWGLDTARVHAILASAYNAFGDISSAAAEIKQHIQLVTAEFVAASPLNAGTSLSLPLVADRTFEIPVPVAAGETISISTGSPDFVDTIAVLLAPDGTPIVGSDDAQKYFAAFTWTAPGAGTYQLWITSFEAVSTGALVVSSK